MDTTDPAVQRELERRLRIIEHDEVGDPAHGAFPVGDLIVLAIIVISAVLVGLIVNL